MALLHGSHSNHIHLTCTTLPYWMTLPSSFLFSDSFCFFSNSEACCGRINTIVHISREFGTNQIKHKGNKDTSIVIVSPSMAGPNGICQFIIKKRGILIRGCSRPPIRMIQVINEDDPGHQWGWSRPSMRMIQVINEDDPGHLWGWSRSSMKMI